MSWRLERRAYIEQQITQLAVMLLSLVRWKSLHLDIVRQTCYLVRLVGRQCV